MASDADLPWWSCPLTYLQYFVLTPLCSLLCLPCVCVQAWRRERRKGRLPPELARADGGEKGETKDAGGVVGGAPAAEPPMFDAAMPREQWPAAVRNHDAIETR